MSVSVHLEPAPDSGLNGFPFMCGEFVLRLYTGRMVCLRRQEPRASDVQDERLFTGCDVSRCEEERLLTRSHVCMRRQEPVAVTGDSQDVMYTGVRRSGY